MPPNAFSRLLPEMPALGGEAIERAGDIPGAQISLMVTRRCNMQCGHCSVESGPEIKTEPSEAELLLYVREAAAARVPTIRLTGGEPMLRPAVVLRLVAECCRHGISVGMTTNGFWGGSPAAARRHLRALRRAGLVALTVSYDRYHAPYKSLEAAVHIVQAAAELRMDVNINVVRAASDEELAEIAGRFAGFTNALLRFYDVQRVGRARELPTVSLRAETGGFCSGCAFPQITDDGRLIACSGPSYFAPSASPLQVGSLADATLGTLLDRHRRDPILDTIRTFGPDRLREELSTLPGFERFPFRTRYLGMCDLCLHVNSEPAAVAALRERLSEPSRVAARRAAARIIDASRRGGLLSERYVNGPGACRIFLDAAWNQGWDRAADSLLGRADLDWAHRVRYLVACGLARPLAPALGDPTLRRWAPAFFVDDLQAQAVRDGLRELVQRETIRRLAAALDALDATGVLLKGSALMMAGPARGRARAARASGDVDIHVDPRYADMLRRRLLATGFAGDADAAPNAPQHLAPLVFRGVLIEIHTRLVPPFWGLPEADLLARARPLDGEPSLRVLSPEGLLLHAAAHTTEDSFSHGLKTAWDILWVRERWPDVDWDLLARWVQASRVPRGIWAPLSVLARDLELPVPAEFLRRAPADAQQARLELIARRRLFHVAEGPGDLNFLSRQALRLLMHEGWLGRVRYLATQISTRGSHRALWNGTAQRTFRAGAWREALADYHSYRRALRASASVCDVD
jgi:DNA-binding transcriptional ArsR family regulator